MRSVVAVWGLLQQREETALTAGTMRFMGQKDDKMKRPANNTIEKQQQTKMTRAVEKNKGRPAVAMLRKSPTCGFDIGLMTPVASVHPRLACSGKEADIIRQ